MANLSNIITPTNVLTATSTNTLSNKTISGASNTITNVPLSTAVTGTLPVANGGTGATSLTANNVLLGNGTSALQAVAPGTAGNILTSNGTTWQSTAPAAAGGTITATASGAISTGNPVVVNSNGTVSAISGTPGTTPIIGINANTVNGNSSSQAASWYDPSTNVIVWVYRNSSDGYLYSVAGVVSGNTVTWGTAQVVFSAAIQDQEICITGENNGTILVSYLSNSGYLTYSIGLTSSGSTSVSWSSSNQLTGELNQAQCRVTYLSTPNRYLFIFSDDSGVYSGPGYMVAWLAQRPTGAGYLNNITYQTVFGARYYIYGAQSLTGRNNTAVVAFRDNQDGAIKSFAMTASASSISYGGPTNPANASNGGPTSVVYYSADDKWLVFYRGASSLRVAAATVSGASLSFGTSVSIQGDSSASQLSAAYSSVYQRVILSWYYVSTWPTATVVSSSGGTVSIGSALNFLSGTSGANGIACVSTGAYFFTNWARSGSPYTGVYVPISISFNTNLTATNFLGFSQGTYSNGATATVNVVSGVNTGQSELTAGSQYYVIGNGTLSTTAAVPSVYAGLATSSSNILVKG